MAPLIFPESRHTLIRAQEHLEALDKEIADFLKSKPHEIVREFDSKEMRYNFRVKHRSQLPGIRWALVIGDCVHNARTALDYLAWALAGRNISNKGVFFPICLKPNDFNSVRWRLDGIHPDVITEIRSLQPHNRAKPELDFLWVLQELDARDKHKLVTPIYWVNDAAVIESHTPVSVSGVPAAHPAQGGFPLRAEPTTMR